MPNLEQTGWQAKVLLDLAFFLKGIPEERTADWRVRRLTMSAYQAAVDLISPIDTTNVPEPRIAPDREGGIQFEWDTLEIGVLPTGTYEYLRLKPDGLSDEGIIQPAKARQLIISLGRARA